MGIEVLGNRLSVREVPFHPVAQRFESLKEVEGVLRRNRRANVTKQLHAGLDDVSPVPQGRPVGEPVVAGIRFGEVGEPAAGSVVKGPTVHDYATDRVAVTSNELGQRVHDNVRPQG